MNPLKCSNCGLNVSNHLKCRWTAFLVDGLLSPSSRLSTSLQSLTTQTFSISSVSQDVTCPQEPSTGKWTEKWGCLSAQKCVFWWNVCVCVCACVCVCVCLCVCVCVCVCETLTHAHMCVCIYIYIYIWDIQRVRSCRLVLGLPVA